MKINGVYLQLLLVIMQLTVLFTSVVPIFHKYKLHCDMCVSVWKNVQAQQTMQDAEVSYQIHHFCLDKWRDMWTHT